METALTCSQPPWMGSRKCRMFMTHTRMQMTAMAFDRKFPNSSSFRFNGVNSSTCPYWYGTSSSIQRQLVHATDAVSADPDSAANLHGQAPGGVCCWSCSPGLSWRHGSCQWLCGRLCQWQSPARDPQSPLSPAPHTTRSCIKSDNLAPDGWQGALMIGSHLPDDDVTHCRTHTPRT
jgi:hypothetical protein